MILVRSSGVKKADMFRWHPTHTDSYWGGRPAKNGRSLSELDYYEAKFEPAQANCGVQVRVASGAWKTETSTDGGGGTGNFVNGHKFCYGKARAYQAYGRSVTAIAVAHNFLGQDRRLVAVDRDGKTHTSIYSTGSDGDPRWVLDQIDAEFDVPRDRVRQFLVQFRPYEEVEIKGIALKPRTSGASTSKPRAETRAGSRASTACLRIRPRIPTATACPIIKKSTSTAPTPGSSARRATASPTATSSGGGSLPTRSDRSSR